MRPIFAHSYEVLRIQVVNILVYSIDCVTGKGGGS